MFLKIVLKLFPDLLAMIIYKNMPLGKSDLHLYVSITSFQQSAVFHFTTFVSY